MRKLTLYAVLLAAVFGIAAAAGAAAPPTGLATAEPDEEEHESGMPEGMVPGLAAADAGYRLVPSTDTVVAGAETTYHFQVIGEDGVVEEFEVEHTKRMHVIVVRRDFAGFQHLHPDMSSDGTWWMPLTIDAPGAYRVFADFVVAGEKQTLATDLFVAGDFRPEVLADPSGTADAGDGYSVSVDGAVVAGEESALSFTVHRHGAVVTDIEPYLGARGHLVALRDGDLAYLHVHADEDRLLFEADFPTVGEYRLFLQFQHQGRVHTAAFTVDAKESSE